MAEPAYSKELWIILAVYLGALILTVVYTVWRRFRAQRCSEGAGPEESAQVKHYLAGRQLGPVSLGFSICASMFSGYTCVGIPAEAYTHGFSAWRWVGTSTFIAIVFIAYAPRLQWLARARGYDSVLSFVRDRYGIVAQHKDPLHWLMVIILLVPCFIYLCAQFEAFANTISKLSYGKVTPMQGGLCLAALLSISQVVGGLHAVALTEVIQGGVLVVGAMLILICMDTTFEGLPALSKQLEVSDPGHVRVMGAGQGLAWAEFWIGVGIQRALLPDFPQRAMAARSQGSLRIAAGILVVSPFLVQVPLLFFGIIGRVHHPGLENANEVFSLVVLDIVHHDAFGRVMGSVMMLALVAAIMATADSVLMVVSQIVALDVIRPIWQACVAGRKAASGDAAGTEAGEDAVDEAGPSTPAGLSGRSTGEEPAQPAKSRDCLVIASRMVTIVAAFVCVPIVQSKLDLSNLIQFQSSILAQTMPTLVLALYWKGLHKWASFAGLIVGVGSGVGLVGSKVPGGILVSLLANVVVTISVACSFPQLAVPKCEAHAEALRLVFWRTPGPMVAAPAVSPCRLEPVTSWWGLLLLAVVLPWFALPLYRRAGMIDPYLSGSPLWAVTAVTVLLLVHALLLYIIAFHWQPSEEELLGGVASPLGRAGEAGEAALQSQLGELKAEVQKLGGTQADLVRSAVREEMNALFA